MVIWMLGAILGVLLLPLLVNREDPGIGDGEREVDIERLRLVLPSLFTEGVDGLTNLERKFGAMGYKNWVSGPRWVAN